MAGMGTDSSRRAGMRDPAVQAQPASQGRTYSGGMNPHRPRLEVARTEDGTATRIGWHLGGEFIAVTVFDHADSKTVAEQLRAMADRIDPQAAQDRGIPRRRRRRVFQWTP